MKKIEQLAEYRNIGIGSYHGSLLDLGKDEGIDVLVNAANTALCLGWSTKRLSEFLLGFSVGGVAGAIGKKAGSSVKQECRNLIQKNEGWFNAGDAAYTSGGNLPVSYIIHAVSTRFLGSNEEIIHEATRNALLVAYDLPVTGIAFPLLGAGAGRIAPARVADCMSQQIILSTYSKIPPVALNKIVFAIPDQRDYSQAKESIRATFEMF